MMQVNQQNPSDSSAAGVLPSNTDYIGPYGFEIGFDPQTRQTKSTSWTVCIFLNFSLSFFLTEITNV